MVPSYLQGSRAYHCKVFHKWNCSVGILQESATIVWAFRVVILKYAKERKRCKFRSGDVVFLALPSFLFFMCMYDSDM